MVVCSLCKRDGHLKKDCPEDFKKVQLDPLPPITPEFLIVLDKVCEQCYSEYQYILLSSVLSLIARLSLMDATCLSVTVKSSGTGVRF